MDKAARMGGASWFQIYWRIILQFLAMRNQYLWPILVIRWRDKQAFETR